MSKDKPEPRTWPVTEEAAVVVQLAIEKRDQALASFHTAILAARKLCGVPDDIPPEKLDLDNTIWIEKPDDA